MTITLTCTNCFWAGHYEETRPVMYDSVDWQACPVCNSVVIPKDVSILKIVELQRENEQLKETLGHDEWFYRKLAIEDNTKLRSAIAELKEARELDAEQYVELWDITCKKMDALDEEIKRLKGQLPDGLKECKILFKECKKGHGRLVADTWIDSGCPWCEIERITNKQTKTPWIEAKDQEANGEWIIMYCEPPELRRFVLGRRICGKGFIDENNIHVRNVSYCLPWLKEPDRK